MNIIIRNYKTTAKIIKNVKSLNPEVTWDLLHTAVIFGYHMGVEDEKTNI